MLEDESVVLKSLKSNNSSMPVEWSERCLQLELSLQRLKSHSGKVRQALLDKIIRLERRALEAETKAFEAERQVNRLSIQTMDIQISGSRNSTCPSPEEEEEEELECLQDVIEEKEKVINKLESDLEEQKKLRLQDAKQVEAKAAKIKEWVANKLKELEDQNEKLRQENRMYNEQLKSLETRLQTASPESRRKIESAISSLHRKKGMTPLDVHSRKYHLKTCSCFNIK